MFCGLWLIWVIAIASSDQEAHAKFTVFSLGYWDSSVPTDDGRCHSRGTTRCAVLCERNICSSFVCRSGHCQLLQKTSIHGIEGNRVANSETNKRTHKTPQLFVYPLRSPSKRRIQKVNVGGWSPSYYPLSVKNVNAIVYIPWTQQLWVASAVRNIVRAYPLYKRKGKSIIKGVSTIRFSVDEGRQLTFIVTSRPHKTVSLVTRDGAGIDALYRKNGVIILDICADPGGKRLFMTSRRDSQYSMTTVGYDGKNETYILTASSLIIFTFDNDRTLLYYYTENWVNKMSVEYNTTSKIKKYNSRILTLFYVLDNIYMQMSVPWVRRYNTETCKDDVVSYMSPTHLNFYTVYRTR